MADNSDKLKIQISRYAVLFAMKARKANSSELINLNTALLLLNQAQGVAGASENEAKKLLSLARNIASRGAQDESKKRPEPRVKLNESGKKSSTR